MKFPVIILTILCANFSFLRAQNIESTSSQERIFIQTDRDAYVTGDTINLKLYLIDETTVQQKILQVIFRNENNVTLGKFQSEFKSGISQFTFVLPDTLRTGIYQIACLLNENTNAILSSKSVLIAHKSDNSLKSIVTKTSTNNSKTTKVNYIYSPERIYIHTDREAYVAGEEVYFKVYQTALSAKQKSKYAYLLFRNVKNNLVSKSRIELNNGNSYGKFLLPDTLSTGVYEIVGYTNCLRNDPENSFFTKTLIIANRFDKELNKLDIYNTNETAIDSTVSSNNIISENNSNEILSITTSNNIFKQREKITIDLKLNNKDDFKTANISVAVRSVIPGLNTDNKSIVAYFDKAEQQNFNWKNCRFLQESQGIIIDGSVLNTNLQKPAANQVILLSTPDSVPNLQYTSTKQDGTFRFLLSDFYFGKNVYLKLIDNINAQIKLDDKYQVNLPFAPVYIKKLNNVKQYLNRNQDFVTIQKDYFEQNQTEKPVTKTNTFKFPWVYAKPYSTVIPGDFFELPDFIEISRELLPSLKIRKSKNGYDANMLNVLTNLYMPTRPQIFLNGIPIDNVNQIITLGSTKIKRIDLYPTERYFGDIIFDGILSVYTGSNELANIKWENPIVSYLELNNHPLSTTDSHLYIPQGRNYPYYKQLLYWEPNITINNDKKFTFYASDDIGFYEINIQGIAANGKPVSITKTIQIVSE